MDACGHKPLQCLLFLWYTNFVGSQTFGVEKNQEMCETEVEREIECVCVVGVGGLCVFFVDKDMTAHSLKCYFLFW